LTPPPAHGLGFDDKDDSNGWKRTTNAPQTGDQVRSPAEEDGKDPDRVEDQQEEEVTHDGKG
jgi:hypothetical protein